MLMRNMKCGVITWLGVGSSGCSRSSSITSFRTTSELNKWIPNRVRPSFHNWILFCHNFNWEGSAGKGSLVHACAHLNGCDGTLSWIWTSNVDQKKNQQIVLRLRSVDARAIADNFVFFLSLLLRLLLLLFPHSISQVWAHDSRVITSTIFGKMDDAEKLDFSIYKLIELYVIYRLAFFDSVMCLISSIWTHNLNAHSHERTHEV